MPYNHFFRYSKLFINTSVDHFSILNSKNILNYACNFAKFERSYSCISSIKSVNANASRYHQRSKNFLHLHKSTINLVSYLTTDGIEKQYQVVITNPSNQADTPSELSINVSEINSEKTTQIINEAFSTNSAGATDIATPLLNELETVKEIAEPTLASLGLGSSWTPVGLIQQFLEYLHITHHMPWWMAIISCTVVARILMIPLLIKTQKNALLMSNYLPQLQYLQAKFGEARRMGNTMEASRYATEIALFMKEHNINPAKNMLLPLLQAPVFISFFFALRGMAKLPVESMKYGGLNWVYDLTIPDPYYILPLIACSTLYIILKVGAESGVQMENLKLMKYVLRGLPVIAFPFCMNFPSAVLYYWCTNNICTLTIVSILKIKPIRQYLNLPERKPVNPEYSLPNKGFIKGVKEAYEDQKVLGIIEDRRRIDEMRFLKAGTGPIPRTYSYDPTKPRPANAAAAAGRKVEAKERKT